MLDLGIPGTTTAQTLKNGIMSVQAPVALWIPLAALHCTTEAQLCISLTVRSCLHAREQNPGMTKQQQQRARVSSTTAKQTRGLTLESLLKRLHLGLTLPTVSPKQTQLSPTFAGGMGADGLCSGAAFWAFLSLEDVILG